MINLTRIIAQGGRVRTAQGKPGKPGKPGKRDFFEKNQGKPGKLREFSDHFYNLRENSGNVILPNISDQIGGAIRINAPSHFYDVSHSFFFRATAGRSF